MDDSPSTGIYPNASVTGGDSLTRTPAYTKVRVEGADGRYIEAEDAVAVASFGPLEKHVRDTSLHSDDSITARASGLLSYEAANRNAVHFKMVEHPTLPRPGTHFKPGDTIPMQLPPGLEKTNKRVQSFAYTNSFPTQYLVTGSRVLSGEAAAYSLLWRLWRRFQNPERPKGGGGFSTGAGGGAPTIVVAASDASERSKSKADFICIGVSDQDVIQQALSELGGLGPGGTLWLTEGTYKCRWRSGSVSVISSNTTGISIRGLGIKASVIEVAGSPTGVGQPIIDLGGQGALVSDLTVEDHQPGTTQTVGVVVSNSYAAVQRVGGFTRGPFIEITSGANDAIVTDCWIDGTFNSGIHTSGAGVVISNCLINIDPTTSGIGVLVDGSAPDVIIENNHIYRGLGAGMNSAQGLILDTGMGTRIVNNTLIRGTIDLQAGDYGQVIGNRISEAAGVQGGQGILVQAGVYGALIADNVIQEPRGSGIEVAGAIGCIFSNNRIIDPGGAIAGDGIFVANGDENHFVGNYIESFGDARYGIHIETSASERNSFLSNRLGNAADYTSAPILDNGTGTIWGNTILDGATDGGGSSSSKVVFFQAGTLTTGSGSFKLPFTLDAEIVSVQLAVGTSPTGADLIVDVNKNGTTVFTTQANRPTVPDGDANGVGAEAVPDVTAVSEGDYLTIDIDQIGSSVAGEDLTVVVEWRPT